MWEKINCHCYKNRTRCRKNCSKKVARKTTEITGELIGYKITEKIVKPKPVSKANSRNVENKSFHHRNSNIK